MQVGKRIVKHWGHFYQGNLRTGVNWFDAGRNVYGISSFDRKLNFKASKLLRDPHKCQSCQPLNGARVLLNVSQPNPRNDHFHKENAKWLNEINFRFSSIASQRFGLDCVLQAVIAWRQWLIDGFINLFFSRNHFERSSFHLHAHVGFCIMKLMLAFFFIHHE